MSAPRVDEDGPLAVWADGFGVWHVRVAEILQEPRQVARTALRRELTPRVLNLSRNVWLFPVRVTDLDTPGTLVYREGPA